MNYSCIGTDAELADLIESQSGCDTVVVDTEFMRRDTFFPQAGLVQLCFSSAPDRAWLVDPLSISEFAPLRKLFRDTAVTKVVHSASEDLEVFQRLLDCQPEPLFDTQRAAAFAGLGFGMGYQALIEAVAGIQVEKDETRSDWLLRPLSDAQLQYAAADVVPLLPVYNELVEKLTVLQRLAWVLEDGATAVAAAVQVDSAPWLRVKTAWKLKPRALASLQRLCVWREQEARRSDKPRNWILQDKILMLIAQRAPQTLEQLRQIPDMPAGLVRRAGEQLLSQIAAVTALDEEELPQRLSPPLDAEQRRTLKELKGTAAKIAEHWGVEAPALLPAKDYELMVRIGSGETLETPARWLGWRQQELIQPLLKAAGVAAIQ